MPMEKIIYSIGEVAQILGENVSLVRFWSDSFSKYIKPMRNAKGNRSFSKDDIEVFKQIHYLVKVEGYTLEGVAKKLRADTRSVSSKAKALESLRAIREQLQEIRKTL